MSNNVSSDNTTSNTDHAASGSGAPSATTSATLTPSGDASTPQRLEPDEPQQEYGLEFWKKRRAEWTGRTPGTSARPSSISHQKGPGISKLETMLKESFAEEDEVVWNNGLKNVWKSLTKGDRLREPLPLVLAIKILRGGWIRDGTWPAHFQIPEDDIGVPEEIEASINTDGQTSAAPDNPTTTK